MEYYRFSVTWILGGGGRSVASLAQAVTEECINKGMGGLHFRSGKQGKPNVKSTVKTAMAKGTKKEFIGQVCYVKAQPEHTIAEAFLNWMKCLLNWMK